ncbi:hypothetical protein LCGC14_2248960 [marine sediment metagenome]|uniref:Uncharacterized protein n=1 Tax=marine sediment metagenome TaxID=412755 RepID=A0A0F9FFQ8_9ZZZZ
MVKTAVKPIVEVTTEQMISLLFAQNTTSFVGFDSITEPAMRKTNNRFLGMVEKSSTVSALGWYQYGRMVNNAQKRQFTSELRTTLLENGVPESVIDGFENDLTDIVESAHQQFESAGLSWGEYMVDPKIDTKSRMLIDHTKKDGEYRVYAQVAILNTKTPVYKWKDTGKELSEQEISEMKEFFPPKKEGSRQGLKRPYIIRTYALDNVISFRINKSEYKIQ